MNKLELKKKEKKESLLSTAFDLFTKTGFNKTSISDIAKNAGVGKGTFYLYFRDKYDIRNKLIAHKSDELFTAAYKKLLEHEEITEIDDKIIFICDYIIDELNNNQMLLNFISKNLSWGIFKSALVNYTPSNDDEVNFIDVYMAMINDANNTIDAPEIMLFIIIELLGATVYSSILYNEPLPIEELKPYLFRTVRGIIDDHMIK